MNLDQIEKIANQIQFVLQGTVIDELRIFSTVLYIGFYRAEVEENLPNSIWLSILDDAVLSVGANFPCNLSSDTFFDRRAQVLSDLYKLMGSKVTLVEITSPLSLVIHFGDNALRCFYEGEDDEVEDEVWSITSDNRVPYEDHTWDITLDKSGKFYLKTPGLNFQCAKQ
jgi:hypothetical protein